MESALSTLSAQPPVLPGVRLSANSRPGFETKNPALYPVHEVWNSTTAIGMRAGLLLNGVGQSELARYYDSRTGTFCSADPLAGDPSDPQSWNRYPYGRNDPIDITDPSGKSWWSDLLIGIGVAAAIYFAPEIFPELADGAGAPADFVPQLVVRSAATEAASSAGAAGLAGDVGATAGAGLGPAISGGAMAAAAAQATDQPKPQMRGPGTPIAPVNPTPCQQKTLNAINKQFGTNGNASNISPSSNPLSAAGGEVNTNFNFSSGLTAAQFNAIQPGRYAPSGFWGWLTGYGPSLHVVAGPSSLDPTAMQFANSNVGGNLSASFTAHIDSAWANNPIGALLHWKIDVHGHSTRNPCP